MQYQEYQPSKILRKYIKCYYSIGCTDHDLAEDKAFATGCIEIMFTLNGQPWQTKKNNTFNNTSRVDLWGQILEPLTFRPKGHSEIFGIRFYPATASFLLKDNISTFNCRVLDLTSVLGNDVSELHSRLQDKTSVHERVRLADIWLMNKLGADSKSLTKIDLVKNIMDEVTHRDFFDNIDNVASRYGITSRYLQKIFVQYTGLTPKLYMRINRFQNGLVLIGRGSASLTDVSYECGYFDQPHFIREFRSFTGLSPSAFMPENSTAILASPNK